MDYHDNPNDAQIEDSNNKQLFVRDAMPGSWLSFAEELAQAAEVLWAENGNGILLDSNTQLDGKFVVKKSPAHSRSYILLASLALENVLKGLLIASDARLISSGRLDKALKSHKLLELARKVDGLELSEDDKHILQVCQDAIPYWGRYPNPLEYKCLTPEEAATEMFHDCFRKLHFRLCKSLYEMVKDGWASGVGPEILQISNVRYDDTIDSRDQFLWK